MKKAKHCLAFLKTGRLGGRFLPNLCLENLKYCLRNWVLTGFRKHCLENFL